MTLIDKMEQKAGVKERTFEIGFGLNYLAYSLPFSTLLILVLLIKSELFFNLTNNYYIAAGLLFIGFTMLLVLPKKEQLAEAETVEKKKWGFIYFFTSLF